MIVEIRVQHTTRRIRIHEGYMHTKVSCDGLHVDLMRNVEGEGSFAQIDAFAEYAATVEQGLHDGYNDIWHIIMGRK